MAKTNPFTFLQQVRSETAKVTWPTRRETAVSTVMVFIMVVWRPARPDPVACAISALPCTGPGSRQPRGSRPRRVNRFAIREGGRTVGAGIVASIVE